MFTLPSDSQPKRKHATPVVSLVGAGPGDPELLTLKALKRLQAAQVVVYDHLVSDEIMTNVAHGALTVYAGKRKGLHSMPQEQINQILVDYALAGKKVVRLKGGDPFVFGRGGEEMQALVHAGIAFEVIPGVTAANAASCYAGIPLTHRDHAQSVLFVTGHFKEGSGHLDWQDLIKPQQTLVVYMGLTAATHICRQLTLHGAPLQRPIAVVQAASMPHQRVWLTTLGELPSSLQDKRLESPTLLVIGDVARLHSTLHWFNSVAPEAAL